MENLMPPDEKEQLKKEIAQDLGKGYYKMSQAKIITLIGCTVTACLTVFGACLYVDRQLSSHSFYINQNTIDIRDIKSSNGRMWEKITDNSRTIESVKSEFELYKSENK